MKEYKQFNVVYWAKNIQGLWYKDVMVARTFQKAAKIAQGLIDANIRVEKIESVW